MKKKNQICEFNVYGKLILIDYGECFITFPENTTQEEMENIRGQLNLFKDCKAPCIVFAEVTDSIQGHENKPLSKRPTLDNDTWISYCKKINEVGKRLEDEEMPLAYHHHMGTVIQSEEDTIRLMQETNDSVKLTIDTGHM